MRKLLVASQKGGVGKTTTTLNLAAAASLAGRRVLVIDADPIGSAAVSLGRAPDEGSKTAALDLGLSGHLWEGAMAATDVLTPYGSPQFAEEDLAACLGRLDRLARRRGYDLILLDAPPSLFQRSRLLLGAATDVLLVLRAEPLAYRTLPGFLSMIKASGSGCRLAGILLTLAPGQEPDAPQVKEFVARLNKRAVPGVIPHDAAAGEALLAGVPMVSHKPDGAASRAYLEAAHHLKLVGAVEEFYRGTSRRTASARPATVPDVKAVPFPSANATPADEPEEGVRLLDPSLPFDAQAERPRRWATAEWLPWIATSTVLGVAGAVAMRLIAR